MDAQGILLDTDIPRMVKRKLTATELMYKWVAVVNYTPYYPRTTETKTILFPAGYLPKEVSTYLRYAYFTEFALSDDV